MYRKVIDLHKGKHRLDPLGLISSVLWKGQHKLTQKIPPLLEIGHE